MDLLYNNKMNLLYNNKMNLLYNNKMDLLLYHWRGFSKDFSKGQRSVLASEWGTLMFTSSDYTILKTKKYVIR